ncbi:hypothetical protein P43SY_001273 [Pythium insidiosum]|uniref:Uncharacterized protein n=1 Tax=Pythium insidiosum TaxID=114742 RepID=A0AAD5LBL9_PYTIN|nr:hypothetical protein P43SY_001273 [Pythium insidiosum]
MRIEHDQVQLATGAQHARKLKQCQKQLSAAQLEKEKLETALQDALDQDQRRQLESQTEVSSLLQESKHLRRTIKQLRQQETVWSNESDELRAVITSMESEVSELKRSLHESQREAADLAKQLSERTTQVQVIESSATECVERMETGMEALQKAHQSEREKRRKLEKLRDAQETEMATLDTTNRTLQARVLELESSSQHLQTRLQQLKLDLKQTKKTNENRDHDRRHERDRDAKTIDNLREALTCAEQQLETTRQAVVDIRQEVASETNALRKDVEALRHYVEDAARAPSLPSPTSAGAPPAGNSSGTSGTSRARREELWVQVPEVQYLQGAVGGLRNELMAFVGEFQRARHALRQQNHKLSVATERVAELEQLRREDARRIEQLSEQRAVSDEAREIVSKEKLEVLKWSQQTCERNEQLERGARDCETAVQRLLRTLRYARQQRGDGDDALEPERELAADTGGGGRWPTRLLAALERESNELLARCERLEAALESATQETQDSQDHAARLAAEMEGKAHEHRETMAEVEALHERNLAEQQALADASLAALELEKQALQTQLASSGEQIARLDKEIGRLQTRMQSLDADLPVLASVVQLFTLTLPPLVMQVNDLLAQKRLLAKENTELVATQAQVECIGHVLQQLLPVSDGSAARGASADGHRPSRRRRRCVSRFRRVVVAVFALNRLRRLARPSDAGASVADSVAGVSVSLRSWSATGPKPEPTRRRRHQAWLPREPEPVIKVLPPSARALSRLSVREIAMRLQTLELPSQVAVIAERGGDGAEQVAACLLHVLHALVPETTAVLQHSLCAGFHCDALLARRVRPQTRERARGRRVQAAAGAGEQEEYEADGAEDSPEPDEASAAAMAKGAACVSLIRRRVLALGKRVEDLHFQRNALQKENYELQFQLEQHALQLRDMGALVDKTDGLQRDIVSLRDQHEAHEEALREQLRAKSLELESAAKQLETRDEAIAALQQEAAQRESRQDDMQRQLDELERTLAALQAAAQAGEDERQQAQVALGRQSEELRHLRQAARKAHAAHQQVTIQLEEELAVSASLRETIERLRSQQETLEAQVQHATERGLKATPRSRPTPRPTPHGKAHRVSVEDDESDCAGSRHQPLASEASSTSDVGGQRVRLPTRLVASHEDDDVIEDERSADDDDSPRYHGGRPARSRETKAPLAERRRVGSRPQPEAGAAAFAEAWQRLNLPSVWWQDDTDEPLRSDSPSASPVLQTDSGVDAAGRSRRRLDVEKVNSAVHDYMDRIDEKLQQMYGIPRSSLSRSQQQLKASESLRASSKAAELRGAETELASV